MATVDGGKLQYEIDIETAKLITGSRKASDVLGYLAWPRYQDMNADSDGVYLNLIGDHTGT